MPDTAKEKPQRGRCWPSGPGKLLDSGERGKLSVAVGDEVIYGKYAGTDIEVDGRDIKILRETRHPGQGRQVNPWHAGPSADAEPVSNHQPMRTRHRGKTTSISR